VFSKQNKNILHLIKTWCICWANDAKSKERAINSPPKTAVKRVDLRRQSATVIGATAIDTTKHSTPIQAESKFMPIFTYIPQYYASGYVHNS
jgi:hypothetical protein